MLPSGGTSMTGTLLPIASIEAEIESFENFVREFNFAGLRARIHGERSVADDVSIQTLLAYFCSHFFQNPDAEIRSYFNSLSRLPQSHAGVILRLASALVSFRDAVEHSDRAFFSEKENNEIIANLKAELKPNSTWVMRFQFMIEIPLSELPIDIGDCHYERSIKNLQRIGEDVTKWISKNCSDDVFEQFKVLASIEQLDEHAGNKAGGAEAPTQRGVKRKRDRKPFLAFSLFPPAELNLNLDEETQGKPPKRRRMLFN